MEEISLANYGDFDFVWQGGFSFFIFLSGNVDSFYLSGEVDSHCFVWQGGFSFFCLARWILIFLSVKVDSHFWMR